MVFGLEGLSGMIQGSSSSLSAILPSSWMVLAGTGRCCERLISLLPNKLLIPLTLPFGISLLGCHPVLLPLFEGGGGFSINRPRKDVEPSGVGAGEPLRRIGLLLLMLTGYDLLGGVELDDKVALTLGFSNGIRGFRDGAFPVPR